MKYPRSSVSYWEDLENVHNRDYKSLKRILLKDRGALGVVAALVLATNIASLDNTPTTDIGGLTLRLATVVLHLTSGMAALVCVWLSMVQYLKIDHLTAEAAGRFKVALRWFEEPIAFLNTSLLMLPPAILCGVFDKHGSWTGLIAGIPTAGFYIAAVILVIASEKKYIGASHP